MLLKRIAQNRKLIQSIAFCALTFVITFSGCQKTDYDNPHDTSVSASNWTPGNLNVEQTSLKTAKLTWTQPDPRIDSFCVESKRGNTDWKVIGYANKSDATYIDNTFIPDPKTPIDYRIYAIAWKNKSFSDIKNITPVFGKPEMPSVAKDLGVTLKVSWNDIYSNEDGYKLEKKVNGGNWVLCADTIRRNSTFYYDKNPELNALITYRFSVRAAGVFSDTISTKPISTIIAQPTWFTVASLSQTSCRVDWKQGEDWTTGYKIDRQLGNSPLQEGWLKLDNTKTTFTDINLPTDQDIKYRVSTIVNNSYSVPKDVLYGLALLDTITTLNPTYTTINLKSKVLDEGGSTITEWGIVYGTSPNPTIADSKIIASTSGTVGYTATLTGLDNSKNYYARTYAVNRRGESYGTQKVFKTNQNLIPQLDVTTVDKITQTNASAYSFLKNDGGLPIIESGFVSSLNPGPTITDLKATRTTDNIPNSITGYFTTLPYGSTCYVRSYAINAVGVGYGSDKSFKTTLFDLPIIDTLTILGVDATRVGLSGYLRSNSNDKNTTRGFVWGSNLNPTTADNIWTDNSQNAGQQSTFMFYITNLTANQTLHVRAYAKNAAGTVYSPDKVITTKNISTPILATTGYSDGYTSVTLRSQVNGDGGNALIEGGFVYALTSDPSINDNKVTIAILAPEYKLYCILNYLVDGTTYYVRSFARNSIGISYGPVLQFTTFIITPARIDTVKVRSVYATMAYVDSYVLANDGSLSSDNGFVYGDNPGPTVLDNKLVINYGWTGGSYGGMLTNLLPDHKYYVRSYCKNSKGASYSPDVVITTKSVSPPILDVIQVNSSTSNSITLSNVILTEGGRPIIETGFVYSKTTVPTLQDSKVTTVSHPLTYGGSYISSVIGGLTAGETYHIRAFATNDLGTSYSAEKVVTL